MAAAVAGSDADAVAEALGGGEGAELAEVTAPVVFQCGACLRVVTDSNFMVDSNAELGVLAFQAVHAENVRAAAAFRTSADGPDRGSTFVDLRCAGCAAVLGMVYKTTPVFLDGFRDRFTMRQDALVAYMLGTCDAMAPVFGSAVHRPTLTALARENTVMKRLVVELERRTAELEARLAAGGGGTAAAAAAAARAPASGPSQFTDSADEFTPRSQGGAGAAAAAAGRKRGAGAGVGSGNGGKAKRKR